MKAIPPQLEPGVSPLAHVHPDAQIDPSARIGPFCVVEDGCVIGPGCNLETHVRVRRARIGADCRIAPFTSIGGAPVDRIYADFDGQVVIGARVSIGERVLVSLGTPKGDGMTCVGDDCILAPDVHIGHDARIRDKAIVLPGTIVGGSAQVGVGAVCGGRVILLPYVRLGDYAYTTPEGVVRRHVPPFVRYATHVAQIIGHNKVGLARAGYAPERIERIDAMVRLLYPRRSGSPSAHVAALREAYGDDPDAEVLAAFIEAGGPFARHVRG